MSSESRQQTALEILKPAQGTQSKMNGTVARVGKGVPTAHSPGAWLALNACGQAVLAGRVAAGRVHAAGTGAVGTRGSQLGRGRDKLNWKTSRPTAEWWSEQLRYRAHTGSPRARRPTCQISSRPSRLKEREGHASVFPLRWTSDPPQQKHVLSTLPASTCARRHHSGSTSVVLCLPTCTLGFTIYALFISSCTALPPCCTCTTLSLDIFR